MYTVYSLHLFITYTLLLRPHYHWDVEVTDSNLCGSTIKSSTQFSERKSKCHAHLQAGYIARRMGEISSPGRWAIAEYQYCQGEVLRKGVSRKRKFTSCIAEST